MTDQQIIQSFLTNDQHGIREVYYAWRMPFEQTLMHLLPNDEDMADAYQETFIRLQQHILTHRLTADNIEHSLLSYFLTIGRYVALEIIRDNSKHTEPIDPNEEERPHIIPHVQRPQGVETGSNYAHDDDPEDEPIDSEKIFYPNAHMDKQERERFIRSWVEQIGAPCAPLLIGHLWKYKSMATLAQELGYSNADSVKSQKAKCMQKVKTFIKNKLIEYGYEY